jgi:hypothetical protein
MLTFQIKDAQLEARILEKARTFGKTAQQFLNDIVLKELNDDVIEKLPFEIAHLDWREHSHIIDYQLTKEETGLAEEPSAKLFSHITDSAKYVHDMRRKPRN